MRMVQRSRRAALVAAALILVLVGGGAAYAATRRPAITTSTPTSAAQVTNIDVLRQKLRNYYGDPLGTGSFGADSSYAKEVRAVARSGERWLARTHEVHGRKAIVFDVDDTTLTTWRTVVATNWASDATARQKDAVRQVYPATPGMLHLARAAKREGYAIFFVTGRGAAREAATLGNLTVDHVGVDAGYPRPTRLRNGEDGLFTKPAKSDYPAYLKAACADDPKGVCTTVHYKSATRAHIESLGYDIVANFGDQLSDLKGGHADRTFKLPNPNYFIP